jgi:hypothetical protein
MLVGGVIHHQLDHHLQPTLVRGRQEGAKVVHGSVHGMHVQVVGNIVAIVFERGWKEGQQPQACDTQILKVVELLDESREIADAVVIAVEECTDVQLVDQRVFVPERICCASGLLHWRAGTHSRKSLPPAPPSVLFPCMTTQISSWSIPCR